MHRAQANPVEIVIGLFIVLVVAASVLLLFRNLMGQQTSQLQDQMIEQNRQNSISLALQKCNNLCQEAQAASCSELSLAKFCLETVQIDYNGNGQKNSVEFGNEAGIYSCESPVYCFQLTDCTRCGLTSGAIGARTCKTKLCSYWGKQGLSGGTLNSMFVSQIRPGECLANPDMVNYTSMHWFSLAFGNSTGC